MDYTDLSKEQLLARIRELELLNQELLSEREQDTTLEYAWTGNLGHWYWNVKINSVTFNPLKITTLGYDKSEIPPNVTYQFFTDKLHPEDYQRVMDVMYDHLYGRVNVYEVEYRIKTKDGKYKWYYDRGKITQYDEDGKPLFLAGIVFDISEKKRIQAELEYKNKILAEMSSIDGLTKISNHRTLIDYLNAGITDVQKTKRPLSIAIFDIDDFKQVNDLHGHVYGDQVLIEIAAIIKKSIRDSDMAGRYGGEEFMIVFMNTDLENASHIAERIRKTIENTLFANGINVTISCGIKQYMGENATDFIHEADKNLYEAKNIGKNLVIAQ
ncbi:sensor domain-containing diguanylate cyclase [Eubacterium barkeri]|uniref:PAS domain S-box-containing protein/diguanylate cyclase (GGDEF) domain-containing protein n=1 Tax=Eubacterium barkeri TaxID=1528 RepID=A0A1H3APJ3_EUBBA|nr:sensor domain-containing diguanylate cyclase [Eubacterium barkeri]SDX30759.1 PAS domain S-box-containing protein/diguanylate cyclase (GGDEF) domain-containing protein [Eubacterium barkeri]